MPPIISLVIVNFNAGDYLLRCLAAVERQTYRDWEVIVVDNASRDESMASIAELDWVKVVCNSENRGFAPAQNQGMRMARGQYIMPLNFDIHLMPNFLEQAVSAFEAFPQVGTISGKILRMEPRWEGTCEFDNTGLLLTRRRMPQHRGHGATDQGQYEQRDLVFGALGAAAVFRRAMLEDIAYQGQYFDESFFTWYEDVDLEWRARLRGWDCLYLPEAVAYHVGDPQKNQLTAFAARHGIRNRWQMILADDCLHCMRRDARWLAQEELMLLRHVVTHGRVQAYLQALVELLGRLPAVAAKRRWVRGQAVRKCLPEYPRPFDRAKT